MAHTALPGPREEGGGGCLLSKDGETGTPTPRSPRSTTWEEATAQEQVRLASDRHTAELAGSLRMWTPSGRAPGTEQDAAGRPHPRAHRQA